MFSFENNVKNCKYSKYYSNTHFKIVILFYAIVNVCNDLLRVSQQSIYGAHIVSTRYTLYIYTHVLKKNLIKKYILNIMVLLLYDNDSSLQKCILTFSCLDSGS